MSGPESLPYKTTVDTSRTDLKRIEVNSECNPQLYLEEYRSPQNELRDFHSGDVSPWILVNWPFLDQVSKIQNVLEDLKMSVVDSFDISTYTKAGLYLYPYSTIIENDFDTWGWYAISRAVSDEIGNKGRVLILEDFLLNHDAYERVVDAKKSIRKAIGTITFSLLWENQEFVTDYRSCHAPDYDNVEKELSILRKLEIGKPTQEPDDNAKSEETRHISRLNYEREIVAGTYAEDRFQLKLPLNEEEKVVYHPVDYLLKSGRPIEIVEGLYSNKEVELKHGLPIIITLLGPSGAGKDSIILPLVDEGIVHEAVTATTRGRRENGEPLNKYIWMREKDENETHQSYKHALINEYGLVECAYHNGNYYGLPKHSLDDSITIPGVTVIVTDNEGYLRIKETMQNTANVVSAFIVPDDYETLWSNIQKLDNPEQRIREAVSFIKDAPFVADYYIRNSRVEDGLNVASKAFKELIRICTTQTSN